MLTGDRVEVRLAPRDDGAADVTDATVRLRWSVRPADRQRLPARCAREDERTVVCGTGAPAPDAAGEEPRVSVRLPGRPSEVTLEPDTAWCAGVLDKDRPSE
ncbi:hypothetical protein [Streptomyces sp. NPDC051452]|uniref:hypothetical protein n=1 Tax=Streptomyces sp. NPDC051452 TaxID=3365654 RepID=UPI0037B3BE55